MRISTGDIDDFACFGLMLSVSIKCVPEWPIRYITFEKCTVKTAVSVSAVGMEGHEFVSSPLSEK